MEPHHSTVAGRDPFQALPLDIPPVLPGTWYERCRAFDDGEYLVAGQASEYVQLGQDAETGNGPGGAFWPGRIVALVKHSTIWDGDAVLFDPQPI